MELNRDRIRAIGWIAAAVLVAVLAVRALGGGGADPPPLAVEPAPAGARQGGEPGATGTSGPSAGATVLVQVAGEVVHPGVYQVAAGARVQDAVARAGGLTSRADQAGINLVAKVADGQQVIVPRRGAAAGAQAGAGGAGPGAGGTAGSGGAAGAGGAKVSLGSATVQQLDSIDGIGPTLAQRIVAYRQQHGGFSSVDELRQVDGIGEKRFQSLRAAVAP
jgi:competence protein ComEA